MNSRDLKRWQLEKIGNVVGRFQGYLSRLATRMEKVGFTPNDELLRLTYQALSAVHSLKIKLHYMTCDASKRERESK